MHQCALSISFFIESSALTLVFGISGSRRRYTEGVFIAPRAGSVYEEGRKRGGVPGCSLRSISGVSGENLLRCAVGRTMRGAGDKVASVIRGGAAMVSPQNSDSTPTACRPN